jgi:hypothetical protein
MIDQRIEQAHRSSEPVRELRNVALKLFGGKVMVPPTPFVTACAAGSVKVATSISRAAPGWICTSAI